MPIPGISVVERTPEAIAIVHEPTAVPLFVGSFVKRPGGPDDGELIRIGSVSDLATRFVPVTATATFAVANDDPVVAVNVSNGYLSVLHYFANGGGTCYVMPSGKLKSSSLLTKLSQLTGCPDISLLAYTDTAPNAGQLRVAQAVNALTSFAARNPGYFVLAAGIDPSDVPDTAGKHVAIYYPTVKIVSPISVVAPEDVALMGAAAPALTSKDAPSILSSVADRIKRDKITAAVQAALDQRLAAMQLPPTAAVAGLIATTDRAFGPWRAPANLPIAGVTQLCWNAGDDFQALFDKGLNLIRPFDGQLAVVMGARTAAEATDLTNRYISVRRLLDMIERDLRGSLGTLVFRPNDEQTWELARAAVENYLRPLWQQEALVGAKEAQAFYVRCGLNQTMTAADIAAGRLVVAIGVAPVRPAEFVEIEFAQQL